MARRKKGAVRRGHGIMCNICGKNCGKGGALKTHIEGAHQVSYVDYKKCFYGNVKTRIADSWDDSVKTHSGDSVVTHVLVRRFIRTQNKKGVSRAARTIKEVFP